MIQEIINNNYQIRFDYSVENSLKSFKEEVLDELYTIYQKKNVNGLLLSGGMDSTFVLRSLIELGLKPKLYTYIHTNEFLDRDTSTVKNICKKYGFEEPDYILIDSKILTDHMFKLRDENFAFQTIHSYCIDYVLSKIDDNCFSGLMSEYSIQDKCIIPIQPYPFFIMKKNKDRVFTLTNDKTFLSFVNEEIFLKNWKKEFPDEVYGNYSWGVRDLIYSNCYPDMDVVRKRHSEHRDLINSFSYTISKNIRDIVPEPFAVNPFRFNIEKYFFNKKLRTQNEHS